MNGKNTQHNLHMKIVSAIGTYVPIKYNRQFFIPTATPIAVKLIMQIIAIDLNNDCVIDVNDGNNANNVILISLRWFDIESCNRNTVDSPRRALLPLL
jgi:hypothetical protein